MTEALKKRPIILLTGATGFVGKVVLAELLRREAELDIDQIWLLIRPGRKGQKPEDRLATEIQASACFSELPKELFSKVGAMAGELSEDNCGLSAASAQLLAESVTHIIHCAASVEFDLPIADAAKANILSSLNMLELAKRCRSLEQMVSVSTAYVTPHPGSSKPIEERLVDLPWKPEEIYGQIMAGKADEAALLKQTGHPNTYTFTKCLAEKLIVANRGSVPLSIVRPSIVSACWKYPYPGWIDSKAAFAGFVALIGAGYLRAVVAEDPTLLDVVPCDTVADRIIATAFHPPAPSLEAIPIIHAVAGTAQSCSIRECIDITEKYYRSYRVGKKPDLNYNGKRNKVFRVKDWWYHQMPLKLTGTVAGWLGKKKQKQKVLRLLSRLNYLNEAFPYFTFNTFNFQSSLPLTEPDFERKAYILAVNRGVYRHLMGRNDSEILIAGRLDHSGKSDWAWALSRPKGNLWVRISACLVRKALRRFTESITFDQAAFEAAVRKIPPNALRVIVPTHRSYLDFVLCSYLFFARPDVGIAIPHIAAAEEFSKIPVLGWLFTKTLAFYVKRGQGKADAKVSEKVRELVRGQKTLEFFIEGTRSRSRQMLPPRRGMLRSLQSTGTTCAILPVALTYDRIPEERSFFKEVKAFEKKAMTLAGFWQWLKRMRKREIHIGRIHLSCGEPLILKPEDDLPAFANRVADQLQHGQAVTTHHLRCFLEKNPQAHLSLEWLTQAIEARGGKVLASPLAADKKLDPVLEMTMRYQWIHHFFPEARAAFPENWAVQHHLAENSFAARPETRPVSPDDENMQNLLKALFEPICRDYANVAEAMGNLNLPLIAPSIRDILHEYPQAFLPNIKHALADLAARQIIAPADVRGGYVWGTRARDLDTYRAQCLWPQPQLRAVGS